jgi:hypothetical protein
MVCADVEAHIGLLEFEQIAALSKTNTQTRQGKRAQRASEECARRNTHSYMPSMCSVFASYLSAAEIECDGVGRRESMDQHRFHPVIKALDTGLEAEGRTRQRADESEVDQGPHDDPSGPVMPAGSSACADPMISLVCLSSRLFCRI